MKHVKVSVLKPAVVSSARFMTQRSDVRGVAHSQES